MGFHVIEGGKQRERELCVFVLYENKSSASAKSHQGNGMTSLNQLYCFYQLMAEKDKALHCMALVMTANSSDSLGKTFFRG